MLRKKQVIIVVLIILMIILMGITVGYAIFSTTLNISMNSVTQQPLTWNIGFQPGTVNGVATVSHIQDAGCGTATATATTILGITSTLADVGDRCSYTFKILNNGTIAGKISGIVITEPSGANCTKNGSTMICGSITYKLHYDTEQSTNLVSLNDTIAAKSGSTATEKTVVLTIEHTGAVAETENFSQHGFSYTITYAQN